MHREILVPLEGEISTRVKACTSRSVTHDQFHICAQRWHYVQMDTFTVGTHDNAMGYSPDDEIRAVKMGESDVELAASDIKHTPI